MINLRPSGELIQDRDQIRDALLAAFDDVIKHTSAFDSDEMAARILLDLVACVVSFKVADSALDDKAAIRSFTRAEALRFEMYLHEHLLRRATADPLTVTDGGDIPTQPDENHVQPADVHA